MTSKKENEKKSDGTQIPLTKDTMNSWVTEVPEFIPTQWELLQIVKYWYLEDLACQWDHFRDGVGFDPYLGGWRRIEQIEKLLGEEVVKKAIADAKQDFGLYLHPRHWDIFLHGDEEQREALQKEFGFDDPLEHERWLKEKEALEA